MNHFATGADLHSDWWAGVTSLEPPVVWSSHDPVFDHVEVGPGRIVLVAGAPGSGKSALLNQWVGGTIAHDPNLRALVGNVEMTPHTLLSRHLSRTSGVALTAIRKRQVADHDRPRLDDAAAEMRTWLDRLAFVESPHSLESFARAAVEFKPNLIVVDYLQRIGPIVQASSLREKMNVLMSELRDLAGKTQACIIAAAAVSRSRDDKGRATYSGRHLTLANLRESSELEFGADDILILAPIDDDDKAEPRPMVLAHPKARDGEAVDKAIVFHRRTQHFEVDPWASLTGPRPTPTTPNNGQGNGKPTW